MGLLEYVPDCAHGKVTIADPMINECTLESALRATRGDWLNKAKLILQLRHQREGIDIDKIIRILKCRPQVPPIIVLSTYVLHDREFKDSPVLLYWQSGLSRRYKQAVLNTVL